MGHIIPDHPSDLPQPPTLDTPNLPGALCAQTDPDLWFPDKGGSTTSAKQVCRRCPATTDCLQYALDNDERFGVWGGLSERERRRLNRQSAAA